MKALLFAAMAACSLFSVAAFAHDPTPAPTSGKVNAKQAKQNAQKRAQNAIIDGIHTEFTETFDPDQGIRYKIRNVKLEGTLEPVAAVPSGAPVHVSLELLHDCPACGNALNQVIVGWGGEKTAQLCIWNGFQRSGGEPTKVHAVGLHGEDGYSLGEANPNEAEWVTIEFTIIAPTTPGKYDLRTRYAQGVDGHLRTIAGNKIKQHEIGLDFAGWWMVDRKDGPTENATIAKIVVLPNKANK